MKARISHLHKKESEWLRLDKWVPEAGELIVYDPDEKHDYARLKIGDGKTALSNLNFFINSTILEILQKQHYFEVIDSGRITNYIK